ncbi:MAG: HmuY family protein [Bacteroidaceae bacterium]|nr:HmuY family protein [Bacteroidaceae bacterium]
MNKRSLFLRSMLGVVIVLLSACNGIFEDIYDEPQDLQSNDYGFIKVDEATNSGTIYIDATQYTRWIYINFHTHQIDSVEITDDMVEPEAWDLAVHRYDAKTNKGSVQETSFTSLDALVASGALPSGNFVADEPSKVTVDMSGMMDGVILYAESDVNPVLSAWLNVDTSTMPPIYTLSNKVYIVKLKDGTYAAVRLSNFMNDASVKGFMTIDYVYPLTW